MNINYPRYKYHQEKAPKGVRVESFKEEVALGEGWVDLPFPSNEHEANRVIPPLVSALAEKLKEDASKGAETVKEEKAEEPDTSGDEGKVIQIKKPAAKKKRRRTKRG